MSTEIEADCTDYCNTYFQACADHEANTYDDTTDCFLTCTTSGWPLKDPNQLNAPGTIECRKNHAILALAGPLVPHCFHSAEVPTKNACGNPP